ncbi:hypothetical protein DCC79_08575 [bacterium]|nr:MAG: hypothetical protein DCC79_08575 [bacterium]
MRQSTKSLLAVGVFSLVIVIIARMIPDWSTVVYIIAILLTAIAFTTWWVRFQFADLKRMSARRNIDAHDLIGARNDTVRTAAGLFGAISIALTLYLSFQTYAQNEQGQDIDRFTSAIQLLGAMRESPNGASEPNYESRTGAIYVLGTLAIESRIYRAEIPQILSAYVRFNTMADGCVDKSGRTTSPPWPDIQAAMTSITNRSVRVDTRDPDGVMTAVAQARVQGDGVNYVGGADTGLSEDAAGDPQKKTVTQGEMSIGPMYDALDLRRTNLGYLDLSYAHLELADLRHANLSHSVLRHADLSGAVLTGACLNQTDLHGAKLDGADLRGVDLSKVVVTLTGAQVGAAMTDATTTLPAHLK